MAQTEYTVVVQGERIDQVAARIFGDPLRVTRLIELNPAVDLFYPHPDLPLRIA
jgi:hypothetical protein